MRTTVDIPDDLFRRAKALAAMNGIKLKDVIIGALRSRMDEVGHEPDKTRTAFPTIESAKPGALTSEMVQNSLERAEFDEDLRRVSPL